MKRGFGLRKLALGLAMLAWGCAAPLQEGSAPTADTRSAVLARCCTDNESIPAELVVIAERNADSVMPLAHGINLRSPYLIDQPQAIDAALAVAEPLDVLTVAAKYHLAGTISKGLMTHALVYLGSEAQLRRAGLWSHPALRPWQAAIQNGARFIEALPPQVRLSTEQEALGVDGIIVMRPRLTPRQKADALAILVGHIGTRFDTRFELSTEDCLFCTELVAHAMPSLRLPVRTIYGRQTILPDDLVATALRPDGSLTFVTYIRGKRDGWDVASEQVLLADLARAWPATKTAAAP